ncbi:NAD(P)H-binding protein [Nonomuraea sp. NPDC050310]|uniref:SDR family oxidoreductase n=1 Tax=Nonomuraea sp. NPDC050310 TaxID=3154935 RepID=UPI0033C6FC48
MRVLVTGATGILGRETVPRLAAAGHEVRAISRRPRQEPGVRWLVADLATGQGVRQAADGVEAVVHLASLPHRGRRTASVDVAGTRRLIEASAGVAHLLYVSITGVQHAPVGYFRHKLRAERLIAQSGLGWTVLRATPFHQWLDGLLGKAGPVLPVDPGVAWQPVDAREVAGRLAELLDEGPRKGIEEYGGPEVLGTDVLARQWRAARGRRLLLPRMPWPGRVAAAQRRGLLNGPARGRTTWARYLTPAVPEEEPDLAGEYGGPVIETRGQQSGRVYGEDDGYEPPTRV